MDEKLQEAVKLLRESNEKLEAKVLELSAKLHTAEKAVETYQSKYDSYVKETLLKEAFLANGGKAEATNMIVKLLERDIKVHDGGDTKILKFSDDREVSVVLDELKSNPLTAASFNPRNGNQGSGSGADASSQVDRASLAAEIMKISDPVERLNTARRQGLVNAK